MTDNIALKAAALSTHIADLRRQQAVLTDKLALALLLKAFEPRAFGEGGSGKCRIGASGSFDGRGQKPSVTIYLHTGEDVQHNALDVPFALWPPTLQGDYMLLPKSRRPALRGEMQ